jgi:hypothetical protein
MLITKDDGHHSRPTAPRLAFMNRAPDSVVAYGVFIGGYFAWFPFMTFAPSGLIRNEVS